jgi:hypothetical protein
MCGDGVFEKRLALMKSELAFKKPKMCRVETELVEYALLVFRERNIVDEEKSHALRRQAQKNLKSLLDGRIVFFRGARRV